MKKKDDVILSVKNLDKYFVNGAFVIKATDNLNFDLSKGEIIGLIGQSGSGKSTAGKAIIRLFKEVTGSIFLEDEIISGAKLSRKNEKKMRSDIQMIFQNPHGSLSPKRNIYSTLMEPLKVHKIVEKEVAEISKNWVELMRINELSFIIGYAKMMLEYFLKRNKEFSLFDNSFQKLKGDVVTGFLTLKEIENYKEGKNKYLLSNIKGIRKSSARISELFNVAEQNFKDEKLSSSNEIKYYDARIELKTFILNKQMVAKKEKYFKDSIKDVAKERKEEIDKYNRNITSVIKSLSVKKKFFGSIAGLTTDPEQYYVYKAFEISVNKSQKLLKQIKNANYFYNAHDLIDVSQVIQELVMKQTKKMISSGKSLSMIKQAVNAIKLNGIFALPSSKFISKSKEQKILEIKGMFKKLDVSEKQEQKLIKELKRSKKEFLLGKDKAIKSVKKELKNILELLTKEIEQSEKNDKKIISFRKETNGIINHFIKHSKLPNKRKKEVKDWLVKQEKKSKALKLEEKIIMKNVDNKKELIGIKSLSISTVKGYDVDKIEYNSIKKMPISTKRKLTKGIYTDKIYDSLESVGLLANHAYRYPHEFSGGQAQRIVIARALMTNPKIIVADEPVASLDVSIQAQILNILTELVKKKGIAMVFIAHDLSLVNYVADKTYVLHLGKIVEHGKTEKLFKNPVHPYTKTLIDSVPTLANSSKPFEEYNGINDYLANYSPLKSLEEFEVEKDHFVLATKSQVKEWKPSFKYKEKKNLNKQNTERLARRKRVLNMNWVYNSIIIFMLMIMIINIIVISLVYG